MAIIEAAKAEIRRKISDFRSYGIPEYVCRDVPLLWAERVVSVLVGSRRCGKTFRCYQEISEMISSGWLKSLEHVCLIDFDNPHFSRLSATDLGELRDAFLSITPSAGNDTHLLFVFDEIHRIVGWEDFVVELSRNVNWRVLVTGSSSRMLKSDISTTLRGKSLSTTMYPLSFKEFLRFAGVESLDSTTGRAAAQTAFVDYLSWGGFPQISQVGELVREALLWEYFDTMLLKDIIQRYNVTRPRQCIAMYRYLLALIGKPFTQNSVLKYLRETEMPSTMSLISNYLSWAEDSWFLFGVPILSDSEKEIARNYRKCYCIDWALAIQNSQSWDGSYSRAFENLVYLHLRRRFPRVNYYLTRKDRAEVDFVALDQRGKVDSVVQACIKLGDEQLLKREIPPLAAAANYFGAREALLVTTEEERILHHDNCEIQIVPAWKWLSQ